MSFFWTEERLRFNLPGCGSADFEADLVIMDRLGQPKLQLARSPRLLFVDREDLYYFDDPASVLPNRLIVARRRGAS